MEKIASFTIDHDVLKKGLYISRVDGDAVTYDLRMKLPNAGDFLSTGTAHTIEHLLATFLRNSEIRDQVIYVGPMGCRTGFYVILEGDFQSSEVVPLMKEMFEFISHFEGEIPGAAPEQCGNYLDQNLEMARYLAKRYLAQMSDNPPEERLNYPE